MKSPIVLNEVMKSISTDDYSSSVAEIDHDGLDELSDEFKAELDRRIKYHEEHPEEGITWEELRKKLGSRSR